MFGFATAFVATSAYDRDPAAKFGAWILATGWITCMTATMIVSGDDQFRALGIIMDTIESCIFIMLYGCSGRSWSILMSLVFMAQLAIHQNYEEGPATLARRYDLALQLDVTYAIQLAIAYGGPRARALAFPIQNLRFHQRNRVHNHRAVARAARRRPL
jgi:hypothetical protein